MELLCWTPVIFNRKGFPRDEEGRPFLPKDVFIEAIISSVIFYYVKKDREIENRVKNYLLSQDVKFDEVSNRVKEIVLNKYPVLEQLYIPEKIYLSENNLQEKYIEVFDLKKWEDVKGFKTEVFKGVVSVEIESPEIEKIKSAAHSFAEALAKIERSFLKDHPLSLLFYDPLINDIKKWDVPLRIGMWTEVPFKGDLLFFWRIKEVRERLIKRLKIDIRPRYVLYLPDEKQTTGWVELKIK